MTGEGSQGTSDVTFSRPSYTELEQTHQVCSALCRIGELARNSTIIVYVLTGFRLAQARNGWVRYCEVEKRNDAALLSLSDGRATADCSGRKTQAPNHPTSGVMAMNTKHLMRCVSHWKMPYFSNSNQL